MLLLIKDINWFELEGMVIGLEVCEYVFSVKVISVCKGIILVLMELVGMW